LDPANENDSYVLQVAEHELIAYAAGGLGQARRREIEGLLACNPDLAAQVMSQMHRMGSTPRPRSGPSRRRVVLASAVTAFCVGVALSAFIRGADEAEGWREADGGLPPLYVAEAAESREAALVRAKMVSQVETPSLDPSEITRMLRVQLPQLPTNWRVVDAQVFPTDAGPSLNLVLETSGLKRLDLFAVRADTLTGERPELASRGRETVAFWEDGDSAYVLSGDAQAKDLLQEATTLSKRTKL
jgi:anti-sigma factor RsiW